jgi:quercetin 2,3-dioxygenase
VKINQDAKLFVTLLAPGDEVTKLLGAKRCAWLQVAKGEVELNCHKLHQGDGVAISDETELTIKATSEAEVLLFELA